MTTVLVTGATGAQGGALARELLSRGHQVRAMTRNPDRPAARRLAELGATPVAGNLDDEASLERACEGVDAVFAVQNYWEAGVGYEREIAQGCKLARACERAGVSHLVQTSVSGCDRAPKVEHFHSKYVIEQYIDSLGLPRTFLREVFFMENLYEPVLGNGKRRVDPALVLAVLGGCLGNDTRLHMVTVEDIAMFATLAIELPDEWIGTTVDVASDAPTVGEMKESFRRVTGRRIWYPPMPLWLLRRFNAEAARQYDWNLDPGWDIDVDALRQRFPQLTTFENFLSRRVSHQPSPA